MDMNHLGGRPRSCGMTAPFVLDGAMNGPMFLAYVKQCLVPTLKRDDTVIMVSLPVHNVTGVEQAIEAAGATLIYFRSIRRTSTPSNWHHCGPALSPYRRGPQSAAR
jgi:hypothetical protein